LCDTSSQNASFAVAIESEQCAKNAPILCGHCQSQPLPNRPQAVTHAPTATWRSGYAAVCKTVYPGSIPGVASSKINGLASPENLIVGNFRQQVSVQANKQVGEPSPHETNALYDRPPG
jgi:hypothetical protein